ncbi:MAG: barstar family protein [Oscillospiraceae bacterium]|nr:barstar family protein [Oscillospiraceae bacterium]
MLKNYKEATIDLTGCKHLLELYKIIKSSLGIPQFYGNNLDALWDILSEPRETYVIIKGVHIMPKDLQEHFHDIHIIFDRTKY